MWWKLGYHSYFYVIVLYFQGLLHFVVSQAPIFIRDCNQIPGFPGADFCAGICGVGTIPSCNQFGLCQCDNPGACGAPAPPALFVPDFCPVPSTVPPDDPGALQGCLDSCPQVCGGGVGEICSVPGPIDVDTYLAICSCYCPPICPPNVTTTTPTPGIVLLPNLLTPLKLKIKKKVGLIDCLIALLFPLVLKLIGFMALNYLTMCFLLVMDMGQEMMPIMGWRSLS